MIPSAQSPHSEHPTRLPDSALTFLHWTWMRALLHRGYWLVASLYLVLDAGLSPFQLVLIGAVAVWIIAARITGVGVARRVYAAACGIAAFGVLLLAAAPDAVTGSAGVLLVAGIGWTVTRAVGAIWVNWRASSEVRATVPSFLAQVEYLGEIVCGIVLGILAQATSIRGALAGACALVVWAGVVVARSEGEHR
jgi:hypothetical protein